MPDTRWILPRLKELLGRHIPAYPIDWVCVDHDKQEIILIGYKRTRAGLSGGQSE